MPDRAALAAQPRTVLGKRVKRLRSQGILPGNVYGRGFDSISVQMDLREFARTVRTAGVRTMFELSIEGEAKPRLVLIRGLDRHMGMGDPMHVDFFQVDVERPVQTSVPLHVVGESAAVNDLGGTLLHGLEALLVRCLPLDIPEAIEVDVTPLVDFDTSISVGDLDLPENVEPLVDAAVMIATVNAPRLVTEEEEEGEEFEGEEGEGLEEGEAPEGGEASEETSSDSE